MFPGGLSEDRLMDFLGSEAGRATHDDLATLLIPLEHGAGPHTQLSAYLRRNGDLPLGRELGVSGHERTCNPQGARRKVPNTRSQRGKVMLKSQRVIKDGSWCARWFFRRTRTSASLPTQLVVGRWYAKCSHS